MITASVCLAMAIYYEARGEKNFDAGLAVAEVILNRVNDERWPDNVCAVVKQDKGPKSYDCQFSFYCDGKPENPKNKNLWLRAKEQAREALNGKTLGHNALYYHADYVSPSWSRKLQVTAKIGTHLFYIDPVDIRKQKD